RSGLVEAVLAIYRAVRNQGSTVSLVRSQTELNHAGSEQYSRAVDELSTCMSQFLAARGLTPKAEEKRARASERWPRLLEALRAERGSIALAEYCQTVDDFRETRPAQSNKTAPFLDLLDPLIWQTKLGGSVPRLYFDKLAAEYAGALLD